MTTIVWPSDTTDVIDAIRGAIGRPVTFRVTASSIACAVCELDPVTNTSTDSFCFTCSGVYWIPVISGVTISGHVTWAGADMLRWEEGGQLFEGDARVQIKYTVANLDTVDTANDVIVDGKVMQIKDKIFRGVPDINRILINLVEKER